jgi:hypothetical protein
MIGGTVWGGVTSFPNCLWSDWILAVSVSDCHSLDCNTALFAGTVSLAVWSVKVEEQ